MLHGAIKAFLNKMFQLALYKYLLNTEYMPKLKAHQNAVDVAMKETDFPTISQSWDFPTQLQAIEARIDAINPLRYASTRNYIHGAVTLLSPYIARGVISLPQIRNRLLTRFMMAESEKLLQELAWREYFQRIWQWYDNGIFNDVKQPQQRVLHRSIPQSIVAATTGIHGIDKAIEHLYATGYMHNHCRMYTAMLTCNIAGAYWQLPASWLYYHLLDGDLASNTLSWQWVAGAFSNKKYYANQENINRYTLTEQKNTFLDLPYEHLPSIEVPAVLQTTTSLRLETQLPEATSLQLDGSCPLLVYNSYNLDPYWHAERKVNRVLLLETQHFQHFPVSNKVLTFIINLATQNINGIQLFVGSFNDLQQAYVAKGGCQSTIWYKEHPTNKHYCGTQEARDWLYPHLSGNFGSFFAFWKQACRAAK